MRSSSLQYLHSLGTILKSASVRCHYCGPLHELCSPVKHFMLVAVYYSICCGMHLRKLATEVHRPLQRVWALQGSWPPMAAWATSALPSNPCLLQNLFLTLFSLGTRFPQLCPAPALSLAPYSLLGFLE